VTSRGNRKSTIFHDDQDRRQFLRIVAQAATYYDLLVVELCLMGTHYHVLLETPERNLSEAIQFINGVYAKCSNRRYKQTGHVFEARFRSLVIQRESYLLRAARYVVRNPVQAGLVGEAAEWKWSTYRATAGLESPPPWLHIDWICWAFEKETLEEARRCYIEYVNAPASCQRRIVLTGVALGSKRFEQGLSKIKDLPHHPLAAPVNTRILGRPTLPDLFASAQQEGPARDRLIHIARIDHGYGFAEIARYLCIDRSTASKAVARHRKKVLPSGEET